MPHKNSGCPKCSPHSHGHGGTKQIKFLEEKGVTRGTGYSDGMEYGRALFKCKWCGHIWEDWGRRRIKREKVKP